MYIKKDKGGYGDSFRRLYPEQHNEFALEAKTITFVVTRKCDLRCTYCYETKCGESMTKEIGKKQ
jgi:sulfatase maturation enzyme AslB (radical SAM superfamily)